MRNSSSNAGAAMPMVSNVGKSAMASEPPHIISTEITIEVLRPYLSATYPKM